LRKKKYYNQIEKIEQILQLNQYLSQNSNNFFTYVSD